MKAAATIIILLWGWFVPAASPAHPAYLTTADATVEADGGFRLFVRFDTLAFALNDSSARIGNAPMELLLAGPRETLQAQLAEAKTRFLHGFRVVTDHGPGRVESIDFPNADQVLAWKATATPVLPVVLPVQLAGRLPTGAATVAFAFPSVLDQMILTVERPGEEPLAEPVESGATSTPLPLKPVAALPRPAPPQAPAPGAKAAGKKDYQWRVVYLLAGGIALMAAGWTIQRLFFRKKVAGEPARVSPGTR